MIVFNHLTLVSKNFSYRAIYLFNEMVLIKDNVTREDEKYFKYNKKG